METNERIQGKELAAAFSNADEQDDDEEDDDIALIDLPMNPLVVEPEEKERSKALERQFDPPDCIDLVSDSDEHETLERLDRSEAEDCYDDQDIDDNDQDEPILPDFEPHCPADSDPIPQDLQQQQMQLHQAAGVSELAGVVDSSSLAASYKNANMWICSSCGADLMALKSGEQGRINHVKRCSKKFGLQAKDVRFDDDYELFTTNNKVATASSTTSTINTGIHDNPKLAAAPTESSSRVNPYLQKHIWHGDTPAAASDSVVSKTSDPSTMSSTQNAMDLLMAGARRKATEVNQKQQQPVQTNRWRNGKRNRSNDIFTQRSSHTQCPKFKKIPGTDFCCDGFQYANSAGTRSFFLTHFHADHYGGITKHWNSGTIYCSIPTANLVHQQLGVERQYLHPLIMSTPTVIESNGKGVTVTLFNANHCPGAVMFLFEVGKRIILHVGDFRWNYDIMSSQRLLRPFCKVPWSNSRASSSSNAIKRIDQLFLDTTYCDPQYDLPSQKTCIRDTVEVARQEVQRAASSKIRLLMLFGAYTIGKEMIYMSVAKKLKLRVYVDSRRYQILSALDWFKEDLSILTTRPQDAFLWVVPLGHINMKRMKLYLKIRMKSIAVDFDRVVGFRPTGWSLTSPGKTQTGVVRTATNDNLTVHSVPYSEHSSFPELIECLESLNPIIITPTVSASTSQSQIDLLMMKWREKKSRALMEGNVILSDCP